MAQKNEGQRYPEGFKCGKSMVFYQMKDIEPNTFPSETEKLVEHIEITSDASKDNIILKDNLLISKPVSGGTIEWTTDEIKQHRVNTSHGPDNINIISQPTGAGVTNAGHYEARCLALDTKILMADGSYKMLKDIKKGSFIRCSNGKSDKVIFNDYDKYKFKNKYIRYKFSDGSFLDVINDHRVFSVEDNCYKKLSKFIIGEHTYNQNGNKIYLKEKRNFNRKIQHCTIWTKNYNSYYANGILCGNRFANIKSNFLRRLVMFCWKILIKIKFVQ